MILGAMLAEVVLLWSNLARQVYEEKTDEMTVPCY
jgi:hypothetical protein